MNADGSLNITDAFEDTTTCKQFEAMSKVLDAPRRVAGFRGRAVRNRALEPFRGPKRPVFGGRR